MRTLIIGLGATALLSACSGDAPAPPAEETAATQLQAGEYEISAKVDTLRSTDATTPATKYKVGDPPKVSRTCVPADGTIDPKAFAEGDESCTALDSYMRNGRMSLQYKCSRGSDQMTQLVDGDFKADSFEAKVTTSTYFAGSGDYELTRTFTGKRMGDCPAEAEKS